MAVWRRAKRRQPCWHDGSERYVVASRTDDGLDPSSPPASGYDRTSYGTPGNTRISDHLH